MIELKMTFATPAEAADALAKLAGIIAPADRPDAGGFVAAPPAPPAALNPATVFGGAAAPVVPPTPQQDAYLQGITNLAPSTAGAVAPPPVPAAPPATSLQPPPAAVPPAPPLAPAAPAPTAPAAPTSPAGVEVDVTGLPWDGRIHSKGSDGKGVKNGDGTWRQKRGLNDLALKGRVEAELRAAMAAGVPPAPPAPPAAPPAAVPPAPPAAVAPPAVPPAAVAPPVETFNTLIARLTPHIAAKRLTDEHITAILSTAGLQSWAQLIPRPDLVPVVAPQFDALLASLPA